MVSYFRSYKIALLRGGPSTEREISLLSGEAVLQALQGAGLRVKDLILPESKDLDFLRKWILEKLQQDELGVCFIALHGWFGEDGLLQEILEEEGYLYTGSDPQASRLAMDKVKSKAIFQRNQLPLPDYRVIDDKFKSENLAEIGFPLLVKPSSQGSSIGVSKVEEKKDLLPAIERAISYDGRAILEEYIEGLELTVGMLEDKPLPVIRIKPASGLYDFNAKYNSKLTEYIVPADVEEAVALRAQELALKAHQALNCNSFSRVDMIYSPFRKECYLLEVNTIPGLTRMSLLPKAAEADGISFQELILKMLKSAFRREKCLKEKVLGKPFS